MAPQNTGRLQTQRLKYTVVTFLALIATWILWSGHLDNSLLMGLGVASTLGVVLLARRLGIIDEESMPLRVGLRPLLYGPWLLWQIMVANIDVAKHILDPKLPIRPRLLRLRSKAKSSIGQVGLANSITLTPGTVTLDVRDDVLLVHALTVEAAKDIASDQMNQRAAWLSGEG